MIDTSLDAWNKVKTELGPRQTQVLQALRKYPNHTTAEIAKILHKSTHSISGRFTKLGQGTKITPGLNLIKRVERRACAVTGGNSWTWSVK